MIIVLKQHAPADKVQAFCNELNSMGFQINDSVGSDTHILGLIGDTKALADYLCGPARAGRRGQHFARWCVQTPHQPVQLPGSAC